MPERLKILKKLESVLVGGFHFFFDATVSRGAEKKI
jgi:hypothetical protein